MTRPEAPKPYPGDVKPAARLRVRSRELKEYKDALNRPMNGAAIVRPVDGGTPVTIQVVDGKLVADLTPGEYRVLASLQTADGVATYRNDTLTVRGYR